MASSMRIIHAFQGHPRSTQCHIHFRSEIATIAAYSFRADVSTWTST